MLIAEITLVQGCSEVTVKDCIKGVARTVQRTLGAPLGTIRVLVTQCRPRNGRARVLRDILIINPRRSDLLGRTARRVMSGS
jgi:phenylpyruvate tautomerase PptA (4-oxalocrotonate tautomerase family)